MFRRRIRREECRGVASPGAHRRRKRSARSLRLGTRRRPNLGSVDLGRSRGDLGRSRKRRRRPYAGESDGQRGGADRRRPGDGCEANHGGVAVPADGLVDASWLSVDATVVGVSWTCTCRGRVVGATRGRDCRWTCRGTCRGRVVGVETCVGERRVSEGVALEVWRRRSVAVPCDRAAGREEGGEAEAGGEGKHGAPPRAGELILDAEQQPGGGDQRVDQRGERVRGEARQRAVRGAGWTWGRRERRC